MLLGTVEGLVLQFYKWLKVYQCKWNLFDTRLQNTRVYIDINNSDCHPQVVSKLHYFGIY
jgi:hypothetical protein